MPEDPSISSDSLASDDLASEDLASDDLAPDLEPENLKSAHDSLPNFSGESSGGEVPISEAPPAVPPAANSSPGSPSSSASTPPQRPVSVRVERSQTDQVLAQLSEKVQIFWQKAQPILKEKSIQFLRASNRFTNHFLDQTWPKLSAQAIAAIPASAKEKVDVQKQKVQPTLDMLRPVWEKGFVPFWQKVVVPLWIKGISLLRSRLPEPLALELTDRFLTVAVITVLVITYWFFSSITGGKPAVANQPEFSKPTATPVITRRPVSTPAAAPKPAPTIAAKPLPKPITPAKPIAPVQPTVPVQPLAPALPSVDLTEVKAQLVSAVASIKAQPTLTETPDGQGAEGAAPEASLISAVRSLESNHRLQATLDSAWYELPSTSQTQAAQNLWEKFQALSKTAPFDQLELLDQDGNLIARSPVVGSQIIVLRR